MALSLTTWISEIRNSTDWSKIAPRLGPMFEKIESSINQVARVTGVDPTNLKQQPDPITKLNVKVSGEMAHVTLDDHSARSRALHYFVEYSNNTNFSGAHVEHLGASRGRVLTLPTNDDQGNKQNYYFRAYSMEPGSEKPSSHVYNGQQGAPTPVQMSGTTNLSLLPSTGSGTASTTGQKTGEGFGKATFSQESYKKS
jgi:hypothetical protein